jgi:hypothetical protein
MNLSFLNRFLKEILLLTAKKIIIVKTPVNKIRLLIIKINTVSRIKNTAFEIGFNLCINEFPGKYANVYNL